MTGHRTGGRIDLPLAYLEDPGGRRGRLGHRQPADQLNTRLLRKPLRKTRLWLVEPHYAFARPEWPLAVDPGHGHELLSAKEILSNGNSRDCTAVAAWVSSDHSVGLIQDQGIFFGVSTQTGTFLPDQNSLGVRVAMRSLPPESGVDEIIDRVGATPAIYHVNVHGAGFSTNVSAPCDYLLRLTTRRGDPINFRLRIKHPS